MSRLNTGFFASLRMTLSSFYSFWSGLIIKIFSNLTNLIKAITQFFRKCYITAKQLLIQAKYGIIKGGSKNCHSELVSESISSLNQEDRF
jgi:hypothetical protein